MAAAEWRWYATAREPGDYPILASLSALVAVSGVQTPLVTARLQRTVHAVRPHATVLSSVFDWFVNHWFIVTSMVTALAILIPWLRWRMRRSIGFRA